MPPRNSDTDTIFALSSAPGKAGVAVFRLSGKHSFAALSALTVRKNHKHAHAFFSRLYNPKSKELIDEAVCVFFAAPNSFTGEDVVEISTHGGTAITAAMYDALSKIPNLRMADPGEFTRRSFSNGKMDFDKVVATSALIDSQTEAQRKAALERMDGSAAKLYKSWRSTLVEVLSFTEAAIDFSEEELPKDIFATNEKKLKKLLREIDSHLATSAISKRIEEGVSIAFFGRPNVGKSSVFNRIVGTNRAIVSATAGTTRDLVSTTLDIDGTKVVLYDTAGLSRAPRDNIEKAGIKRSKSMMKTADIKIFITDRPGELGAFDTEGYDLSVLNKSDKISAPVAKNILKVSAKTGENINKLIGKIAALVKQKTTAPKNAILASFKIESALKSLHAAITYSITEDDFSLTAEHLRAAAVSIGQLTGDVHHGELLDNIFSKFCIGK
ncbi:MAG: tRNA uridine-5-carboxymethylaminomethyl(34) synthesis GTPase MnmE [Alphaproteobacteria bacterium]|nr:tRNA uridine-5-carboxymethylaminomethyl(34) synthesis GTPase MnmE [Alphaproteobacteria bacterium]